MTKHRIIIGEVREALKTLPIERFGYTPPVPIVADVSVVKYWGGK